MQTMMPTMGDRAPPNADDIRSQLERILRSPEFPGVGRRGAFLTYVTEEVLAGRSHRIKGYTIAIEVFGRDESFTQEDPVVRIEAGRLRRALERYYLVAGQCDPIVIDIAKGGYAPTFTWRGPAIVVPFPPAPPVEEVAVFAVNSDTPALVDDLPRNPWWRNRAAMGVVALVMCLGIVAFASDRRSSNPPLQTAIDVSRPVGPGLVVLPFADLGDGPDAKLYAAGLTEELLTALPRFKEIKVFGREASATPAADAGIEKVGHDPRARYLVSGGVRVSGQEIRMTARLLDTANGAILWSHTYDEDLGAHGLFDIQKSVADQIATAVAQPYGIIAQVDSANLPPEDLDAYSCTLRFYAYRSDLSVERHRAVRDCLERAIADFPGYATAWAMLSMIFLDEDRFQYNTRPGAPNAIARSLHAARRAVQIDPENTRGLQSLMTALFFNRQPAESLRVGEQALAINPNDLQLQSEFGTRLAMSGDWRRGASVLRGALAGNPDGTGYYRGILALADYMQGHYENASQEIKRADMQKFPLFHIVAALIYSEQGMVEEASQERTAFNETGSGYLVDLTSELEKRVVLQADRDKLLLGLNKAGFHSSDVAIVAPSSHVTR